MKLQGKISIIESLLSNDSVLFSKQQLAI